MRTQLVLLLLVALAAGSVAGYSGFDCGQGACGTDPAASLMLRACPWPLLPSCTCHVPWGMRIAYVGAWRALQDLLVPV